MFTVNSQENMVQDAPFLADPYLKGSTGIRGVDFINLPHWVLQDPDSSGVFRNNYFRIENLRELKESPDGVPENNQDYSGFAELLFVIAYYAIPNNLPRNRQQQEMIDGQIKENLAYGRIINDGYNGFRR
jgi:hypothetical protein